MQVLPFHGAGGGLRCLGVVSVLGAWLSACSASATASDEGSTETGFVSCDPSQAALSSDTFNGEFELAFKEKRCVAVGSASVCTCADGSCDQAEAAALNRVCGG